VRKDARCVSEVWAVEGNTFDAGHQCRERVVGGDGHRAVVGITLPSAWVWLLERSARVDYNRGSGGDRAGSCCGAAIVSRVSRWCGHDEDDGKISPPRARRCGGSELAGVGKTTPTSGNRRIDHSPTAVGLITGLSLFFTETCQNLVFQH
jgi:hypothetical protein